MAHRVLVVEDEPDIAALLDRHLRELHCEVKVVRDSALGLREAQRGRYDLVILDLMLSGMDGVEIRRRLRAEGGDPPVLMLAPPLSGSWPGPEAGADDWLARPFSIVELVARVQAIFRRADAFAAAADAPREIRAAELCIHPERRQVTLAGKAVELSAGEFELLLHFARNPDRIYTRSQLLDQIWGERHGGHEPGVNAHINRLRAKIETDPEHPRFIQTVRGIGYKFNPNPDTES